MNSSDPAGSTTVSIAAHPSLRVAAFVTVFPRRLGDEEAATPAWLADLLRLDADAPLTRSEECRAAVRDMLRHGGYKPTGRGKLAILYMLGIISSRPWEAVKVVVRAPACRAP
jgi:hypothetical protein